MDKRKAKMSKKGKEEAKKRAFNKTIEKNVKNRRVCGSGNPMPSYKELKAMYENPGEEITPEVSSCAADREASSSSAERDALVTPVKVEHSVVNSEGMVSPNTLQLIAARALQYLQTTNLIPSAKDPNSTRKKLNFSLSNGVDHEIPTKQRLKKKVIILGNDDGSPELPEICLGDEFSIPNSGDNKDMEAADSDSTINYDVDEFMNTNAGNEVTRTSREPSFSPIPSTSRNEQIFEQNDIIYEKCILRSKVNISSVAKTQCGSEADTFMEKVRTPSPPVKIETVDLAVDTPAAADPSKEVESKRQAFDKLLEEIDLEESDHEDLVVVNVDDVIQENNALFKKFKSENNPEPEPPPLTNISSIDNRPMTSLLNVTPKAEIIIDDEGDEIRIKKRKEEMSLIVTNYFQQTPIVINDTQDSEMDDSLCTSASEGSELFNSIMKYIASSQLIKTARSFVNHALGHNVDQATRRKRPNRIAGSCQIVDFVNLDNYASPIRASNAFSNEIIILDDDSESGVSISDDNCNDVNIPSTSAVSDSPPSTPQGVCRTSTPLIEMQGKRRGRKRKSDLADLKVAANDTPKKVRLETTSTNETEGSPRRNIGDCPICLEALMSKPISSTVCGHIFCLMCIQTIMKTSKRCPTCRKVLRGAKAYHPIFL